jgi:hypothetical protein
MTERVSIPRLQPSVLWHTRSHLTSVFIAASQTLDSETNVTDLKVPIVLTTALIVYRAAFRMTVIGVCLQKLCLFLVFLFSSLFIFLLWTRPYFLCFLRKGGGRFLETLLMKVDFML